MVGEYPIGQVPVYSTVCLAALFGNFAQHRLLIFLKIGCVVTKDLITLEVSVVSVLPAFLFKDLRLAETERSCMHWAMEDLRDQTQRRWSWVSVASIFCMLSTLGLKRERKKKTSISFLWSENTNRKTNEGFIIKYVVYI